MKPQTDRPAVEKGGRLYGRRAVWFVTLWCAGLGAALLLALPFKLLIHAVGR
ncbi:MAG TPA: hypothetical protein VL424_20050 [Pararobbsia sp.]|nr:hypothetical protein [Pararobbsia sp.]